MIDFRLVTLGNFLISEARLQPLSTVMGRETGPRLSDEYAALVRCVRRALGQDEPPPGEGTLDWELALQLAVRQGLAPLVYSGLAAVKGPLPANMRSRLRAHYLASEVRVETHLEPELRRVLRALAAEGIEPLALKGAALAYNIYPSPAHRTMADVDLLIAPGQIDRASEILLQLGFWIDEADHLPSHHHRPYHSSDSPLAVELHHHLLSQPHPYLVHEAEIQARSQVRPIAGVDARVMAPTDALWHTCVHLAAPHRYRLYPLRSLVDILAITTRRREELDWELLVAVTKRSRTAGAVYWPLHLSELWLGAPVPQEILSELAPPAPIRRVLRAITEPSFILENQTPSGKGSDTLYKILVTLSLHTGCPLPQQARVLLGGLCPPLDGDADLPSRRSRLGHAAYLISPARLSRGLGALRRLALRLARP